MLGHALEEAAAMLEDRREALDRLVAALLERESLERDELLAILGPRPGPVDASGADRDTTAFPTNGSAASSSSNIEDDVHGS